MSAPWTDERVEQLRTLRAAGKSGSEIASEMGGVTRCAVIGKLSRLGIPCPPGRAKETQVQRSKLYYRRAVEKTPKPAPVHVPDPAPTVDPVITNTPHGPAWGVSFDDLERNHCRWVLPLAPIEHARFCGEPRMPGNPGDPKKPYCEAHCARAYIKRRKKAEILASASLDPSPSRYVFGAS